MSTQRNRNDLQARMDRRDDALRSVGTTTLSIALIATFGVGAIAVVAQRDAAAASAASNDGIVLSDGTSTTGTGTTAGTGTTSSNSGTSTNPQVTVRPVQRQPVARSHAS